MFNLVCGFLRNNIVLDFEVNIDGCPWNGVKAVDFRRKHGLPEEPTNLIKLPGRKFVDEAGCRRLKNHLNNDADVNLENIYQYGWQLNATNELYQHQALTLTHRYGYIKVMPKVIKYYLENGTAEACERLLQDVISYQSRTKKNARKQMARKKKALV